MDEHLSLDDVLPLKFSPFTPLKILAGVIIPAPSPFLTPYIVPQLTQPGAFKL